mmetsp:Transcript_13027/g.29000  ORF Transcript_13027/g.29000 Transcript_13027/m.29000 type:complete len:267 (+) Transcript_13027:419-1219(+)
MHVRKLEEVVGLFNLFLHRLQGDKVIGRPIHFAGSRRPRGMRHREAEAPGQGGLQPRNEGAFAHTGRPDDDEGRQGRRRRHKCWVLLLGRYNLPVHRSRRLAVHRRRRYCRHCRGWQTGKATRARHGRCGRETSHRRSLRHHLLFQGEAEAEAELDVLRQHLLILGLDEVAGSHCQCPRLLRNRAQFHSQECEVVVGILLDAQVENTREDIAEILRGAVALGDLVDHTRAAEGVPYAVASEDEPVPTLRCPLINLRLSGNLLGTRR